MAWARLLLGMGGLLLLTAPFLPYTTITVGAWSFALRGIFLSGVGLIICGSLIIGQAAWGRGSLLFSWIALFIASLSLQHDVRICLKDIGLALGKVQLAFSSVNQILIGFGLPPLHFVEAQQISHRQLEAGVYWAGMGILLAVAGTIVWLAVQGRKAVWAAAQHCACGRILRNKYRYCPNCGELIKMSSDVCRECGAHCEEDWHYCAICGAARQQ